MKTLVVALGHDELGGFASSDTTGITFAARQNLWAKDVMWRMWAMTLGGFVYECSRGTCSEVRCKWGGYGEAHVRFEYLHLSFGTLPNGT